MTRKSSSGQWGQLDEESQNSLFPDDFTAGRFIAVVESDELWQGIC